MARPRRVRVIDRGYSRLLRAVAANPRGRITVGVHPREGRARHPAGMSIAALAAIHATGAGRLPVRDPVGAWWDRVGRRRVLAATRSALQRSLLAGRSPLADLDRAGRRYADQVRAEAARLRRLRPATIARKRSARILVESGTLLRAITHRARVGRAVRR